MLLQRRETPTGEFGVSNVVSNDETPIFSTFLTSMAGTTARPGKAAERGPRGSVTKNTLRTANTTKNTLNTTKNTLNTVQALSGFAAVVSVASRARIHRSPTL